jgi:hypothetical protein
MSLHFLLPLMLLFNPMFIKEIMLKFTDNSGQYLLVYSVWK